MFKSNLYVQYISVRATTRTGYKFSCNLIGSYAEPKHWIDRERTKLQVNNSPVLQDHARGEGFERRRLLEALL